MAKYLFFQSKTTSSSQRQITVSSRQESVTASKVTKAFSSSSTISRTTKTQVASLGHVPKTPQPSVDFESIPPPKEPERKSSLVSGTSNANFKKIQAQQTKTQGN